MKKILLIISVLFSLAASSQCTNCGILFYSGSSSGGGTGTPYVVSRTFRLNLGSQFVTSPAGWNNIAITNSKITGYVSPALVDTVGTTSSLMLTLTSAFNGATGSAPTPGVANSGLFADLVEQSGLVLDTTTSYEGGLTLTGGTPGLYYAFYCYGNAETFKSASQYWHIGAVQTATISTSNNYGTSSSNVENSPTVVGLIKNIQCDGSGNFGELKMHMLTSFGGEFNGIIIKVSTMPMN